MKQEKKENLFELPELPTDGELTEILASGSDTRIERIVSTGQASPEGFWYDQDEDEWVAVLQGNATLAWKDGTSTDLVAGDYVFIPAHIQHRVESTSTAPPCIWLAIFGRFNRKAP